MVGQAGEGLKKFGGGNGCLGRRGRADGSEGVGPLVFQVVVGVAQGGGVGVVGGAVLGLLQQVALAAGDVVQQEVQPVSFALAVGGVAALGAFEGGGQQIGPVRAEHVVGVERG